MLEFLVLVLAVWRISAFLTYEKSGEGVRDLAKTWAVGSEGIPVTYWGRVLSCFWCTSMHVGGVLWLLAVTPWWWVLLPLAASGAAILLNHLTRVYLVMEKG